MIADPSYGTWSHTEGRVYVAWTYDNSGSTATTDSGVMRPQVVVIYGYPSCGNQPDPESEDEAAFVPKFEPAWAPWRPSQRRFTREARMVPAGQERLLWTSQRARHRRERRWHPNQEHPMRTSGAR